MTLERLKNILAPHLSDGEYEEIVAEFKRLNKDNEFYQDLVRKVYIDLKADEECD